MSDTDVDVVYVDLIKDEPMTLAEYTQATMHTDDDFDMAALEADYREYRDRFQPYRWHSKSRGNMAILGQGERYFNEADAEHNIRLQYANTTRVFLRRAEHGNELIREAFPRELGDMIVIGPECFASMSGTVISWRGANYTLQPEPTA